MKSLKLLKAQSTNCDANIAVSEIFAKFEQKSNWTVVVLFCSSKYDLEKLGIALNSTFTCPIVCCTTSGELGPDGYSESSLVGFALSSLALDVRIHMIDHLSTLNSGDIQELAETLKSEVNEASEKIENARAFGFLLIDGMSVREEQVISDHYVALGSMPLVGGSAGDDLHFDKTYIYYDGQFKSDAAIVAVFITSLPFEIFKTQHFVPTDQRLVITSADPATRTVHAINGRPAVDEYAKLVGVSTEELSPEVFSCNPVMLKIGGDYFVRSIQRANSDKSLSFYCAIDKGVVLTLGSGVNILDNLEKTLEEIELRVNASIIIGCECILRRLEVVNKDIAQEAGRIMSRHNVVGFHTYGEQILSMHVNQTFTGVAIGEWA